MKMKNERIALLVGLVTILIFAWIKPFDALAERHVDEGLKRAGVTFLAARILNGVISVAQGTEISIAPAGVGANFTPGQILDPINDLVEQFSELMLIATVAFGIMKVALSIGGFWVFSLTLSVLAMAWVALRLKERRPPLLLTKAIVILIFIRFSIPLVALTNEFVYQQFLANDYQKSSMAIEAGHKELSLMSATEASSQEAAEAPVEESSVESAQPTQALPSTEPPREERGLFSRMFDKAKELGTSAVTSVKNKFSQIGQRINPRKYIEKLKLITTELVDHIIKLIVVFVLQTIVVPLCLTWGMYQLFVATMRYVERSDVAKETA